MKQLDIELIRYEKLKHIKFLVNKIQQRKEHIHNEFEIFVVLKGSSIRLPPLFSKLANPCFALCCLLTQTVCITY